jgi:hypothetical protein
LDGVALPYRADDLQTIFTALRESTKVVWNEGVSLFGINRNSCGYDHMKVRIFFFFFSTTFDSHFQGLAEIFFESENGPAMLIRSNQELALYAHAKGDLKAFDLKTALCLDVGDVTTTATAFVHGMQVASRALRLGGRDVTNYLRELLNNGTLNQELRSQGMCIVLFSFVCLFVCFLKCFNL